jgi:hypothetical protein
VDFLIEFFFLRSFVIYKSSLAAEAAAAAAAEF